MRRVHLPAAALVVACGSAWLRGDRVPDGQRVNLDSSAFGRGGPEELVRYSSRPKTGLRPEAADLGPSGAAAGDSATPYVIKSWERVDDLPRPIAVFDTVFWEPEDTQSLRELLADGEPVRGKRVLEIGTGTGLLSLCCLRAGAAKVVATEINPAAVSNALYNARLLGLDDRFEVRQVPLDRPQAFSVVGESERFDLVISNPPWENARPESIDKYAYFDLEFQLLQSLLDGLEDHLRPGGVALLAYGSVDAISTLRQFAPRFGLEARTSDQRSLQGLPIVFLPGMLIEIAPKPAPTKGT